MECEGHILRGISYVLTLSTTITKARLPTVPVYDFLVQKSGMEPCGGVDNAVRTLMRKGSCFPLNHSFHESLSKEYQAPDAKKLRAEREKVSP